MTRLESPGTVRLLGALVESIRGASRELLQQKTGLSTSSFYRIMKPLLRDGLVVEDGSRYRLPLGHPYNFLFKRLHDVELVDQLRKVDRDRVHSVSSHAQAHLKGNLLALWLVGSAAHQTMNEGSDLDFLAVVRTDSEYFPDRSYDVHFILMTEDEFRARWAEKSDFVLTALGHGILLEDCGFAQEFYLEPLPVKLQPQEFHQDEEELAEQKERIMLFVKSHASKETAESLSRYAISAARRILRVFGILPAGKPALFRASETLLGPWFTQLLEKAVKGQVSQERHWATNAVETCHLIETAFQSFSSHLTHLQNFAELVTANGERFEELCAMALAELAGGPLETVRLAQGADLLASYRKKRYLFEFKSLVGPCTEAPLRQLQRVGTESDTPSQLVLVANPYRQIPILERKETFGSDLLVTAQAADIKLRTSLELLRLINRLYLEPSHPPGLLLQEFLGSE